MCIFFSKSNYSLQLDNDSLCELHYVSKPIDIDAYVPFRLRYNRSMFRPLQLQLNFFFIISAGQPVFNFNYSSLEDHENQPAEIFQ